MAVTWISAASSSGTADHCSRARRIRRPVTVLVLAGLASLVTVLGSGNPAGAHAVLEGTSPADGAVTATGPARVSLTFGEPVTVEPGAIRVYDDHLHRVDHGVVRHVAGRGNVVGVAVHPGLAAGTYTVTWRVISADSHPVSGGFRFSIGHRSAVSGTVHSESSGSHLVGLLLGATRLAGFAGLVLGPGAAAVLFALWPGGRRRRRARGLVWTGWGLLLGGAVTGLLLQGPYGAGTSLGHVTDSGLLASTIASRFGVASIARIGLLLALFPLLAYGLAHRTTRRGDAPDAARQSPAGRPPVWVWAGGLVVTTAVLLTFGFAGHAGTDSLTALTMLSDVVHLAAMSVWIGGLTLLITCLFDRAHAAELAVVLPRFSQWAFTAVAVLVASGAYQSWREVGSWPALVDTTYGRLLLAKIGAFALLILLGNLARRWVHRHYAGSGPRWFTPRTIAYAAPKPPATPQASSMLAGPPPGRATRPPPAAISTLRRGLLCEVTIGLAVLVLTAILVNTAQAKETYAPTVTTTLTANQTRLHVTVDPAHTGKTLIQLQVSTPSDRPQTLQQASGSLTLPAEHVGPLPITFHVHGGGHAQATTSFPTPGQWQLNVTVQTSAFTATTFRATVPVH